MDRRDGTAAGSPWQRCLAGILLTLLTAYPAASGYHVKDATELGARIDQVKAEVSPNTSRHGEMAYLGRAAVTIGTLAVPLLIGILNDRIPYIRFVAAKALAEIGDPRASEPLASALRSRDAAVVGGAYKYFMGRDEAHDLLIEALGRWGYADDTMLGDLIRDGSPRLRAAAEAEAKRHGIEILRIYR